MENNSKILQTIKNDMPTRGTPKLLLIGITALIIFIEASLLVFFVPGSLPVIQENGDKITTETTEVQNLERAVAVLNQTDEQEVKTDLTVTEHALPSEKSVTGLVSALSSLATSSGTQVNEIQISFGKVSSSSGQPVVQVGEVTDVALPGDVVGVPLTMNVAASDLQALDLVGQIQRSLPLLGINKFTYTVSGDKKTANLSVLIYSQRPDKFNLNKIGAVTPLNTTEKQAIEGLSGKTNILQ